MIGHDFLNGKEKVSKIMRGGKNEFFQWPKGVIKTGEKQLDPLPNEILIDFNTMRLDIAM